MLLFLGWYSFVLGQAASVFFSFLCELNYTGSLCEWGSESAGKSVTLDPIPMLLFLQHLLTDLYRQGHAVGMCFYFGFPASVQLVC